MYRSAKIKAHSQWIAAFIFVVLLAALTVACGPAGQEGAATQEPGTSTQVKLPTATFFPSSSPTETAPVETSVPAPTEPESSPTAPAAATQPGPDSPLESLAPLAPENVKQLALVTELRGMAGFSPDGRTISAVEPVGITLYDRRTLNEIGFLPCRNANGCPFDFSADGKLVAWSPQNGTVAFWDLMAGALDGELTGVQEECCSQIVFSPDGRLLVLSAFPNASVWDSASRAALYRLENVDQVSFSPDGQTLATTSLEAIQVQLRDLATGEQTRTLEGFQTAAPVYNVVFSQDWSYVLWLSRASGLLMDAETGRPVVELALSSGQFSPDARFLAGTELGWGEFPCTGQVCLYDTSSGKLLSTLRNNDLIQDMKYSPDGRLLATADQNGVTVWDVDRGGPAASVPLPESALLAFSPDGQILAASLPSGISQLWGIPSQP